MILKLIVAFLLVMAVCWLVNKAVKVAAFLGIAAAAIYYGYPLAEQYIVPIAGSF